ncbi:ribbon-helix-helix domain-containing protein (plasmid) [Natrialbaceae archaeon A-CW2]
MPTERNGATPIQHDRDRGGNETDRLSFRTDRADDLEALVDRGVYPNRSEAIRAGIDHVLEAHRVETDGGRDEGSDC